MNADGPDDGNQTYMNAEPPPQMSGETEAEYQAKLQANIERAEQQRQEDEVFGKVPGEQPHDPRDDIEDFLNKEGVNREIEAPPPTGASEGL